jgi:prevent-host-death family protein
METVGAYEAKTSLSKLLERVSRGEAIEITKHGVTVAILQPPEKVPKTNPSEAIRRIRLFRKKHTLREMSLLEMIAEGRR